MRTRGWKMESRGWRGQVLACSLLTLTLTTAGFSLAQVTGNNWSAFDGGGGTSTGGLYSIRASVGQTVENSTTMSGGLYSLNPGFWGIQIIQTPGAPRLSLIRDDDGQLILSWAPESPGWVLQESLSLTSPQWVDSASGSANNIPVPFTGQLKFYRLIHR